MSKFEEKIDEMKSFFKSEMRQMNLRVGRIENLIEQVTQNQLSMMKINGPEEVSSIVAGSSASKLFGRRGKNKDTIQS